MARVHRHLVPAYQLPCITKPQGKMSLCLFDLAIKETDQLRRLRILPAFHFRTAKKFCSFQALQFLQLPVHLGPLPL